jgi:hypothetical protein
MTFAIIGIRVDHEFTQVFGPVPAAEAADEFKRLVELDLAAESDGVVRGILELYELRHQDRRHKIRSAAVDPPPERREEHGRARKAKSDEAEDADPRGRKKAAHSE